jgi:hypothetical protein
MEGLVIDLSRRIDTVRVDPEQKLADVGGEGICAQVDRLAGNVIHVCPFHPPFQLS